MPTTLEQNKCMRLAHHQRFRLGAERGEMGVLFRCDGAILFQGQQGVHVSGALRWLNTCGNGTECIIRQVFHRMEFRLECCWKQGSQMRGQRTLERLRYDRVDGLR